MARPEIVFAGTVRQYRAWAPSPTDIPADATHVSVWEMGARVAVVAEKTAYRKTYCWQAGQWAQTEAHYVARRELSS